MWRYGKADHRLWFESFQVLNAWRSLKLMTARNRLGIMVFVIFSFVQSMPFSPYPVFSKRDRATSFPFNSASVAKMSSAATEYLIGSSLKILPFMLNFEVLCNFIAVIPLHVSIRMTWWLKNGHYIKKNMNWIDGSILGGNASASCKAERATAWNPRWAWHQRESSWVDFFSAKKSRAKKLHVLIWS